MLCLVVTSHLTFSRLILYHLATVTVLLKQLICQSITELIELNHCTKTTLLVRGVLWVLRDSHVMSGCHLNKTTLLVIVSFIKTCSVVRLHCILTLKGLKFGYQ